MVKQGKSRQHAKKAIQNGEAAFDSTLDGHEGRHEPAGGSKKAVVKHKAKATAARVQKKATSCIGSKDKPVAEVAEPIQRVAKRPKAEVLAERSALKATQQEMETALATHQAKHEEAQDQLEQLNEQKHALVIKLKQVQRRGAQWFLAGLNPPSKYAAVLNSCALPRPFNKRDPSSGKLPR